MKTLDEKLREQSSDSIDEISELVDIAEKEGIVDNHDGFPIPRVFEINDTEVKIGNYLVKTKQDKILIEFHKVKYYVDFESKVLAYNVGFIVKDKYNKISKVYTEECDENSPLFAIIPKKGKLYFFQFIDY